MKNKIKLTSMIVTISMLSSISTTVFAGYTGNTDAGYYGTLTGVLDYNYSQTEVSQHLDEANFRTTVNFIDRQGTNLNIYQATSYGQTLYTPHTGDKTPPDKTYAIYGAHEVFGESSAVAYTYLYIGG